MKDLEEIQNHRTYNNPPVTEAVFDILCDLPKDFDYKIFESLHEKIKKDFPIKELTVEYKSSIQMRAGSEQPTTETYGGPNGFFLKTSDNNKIIQLRTNGFSFNKLKPYSNWDDFSGEAFRLWEEYVSITNPIKINRMGLRYINRIDIPLPLENLNQYIKTYPEIAADVPQEMIEFFMRLVIPDPISSSIGIITQTIDYAIANKNPQILPLIFDIDVFRVAELKPDDKKSILEIFNTLRNFKNVIFHNSITKKTVKLFE